MDNVFWNDYDASNNAFTRMEAQTKENKPEGDNTSQRRSSASNADAQHGDGKMGLSLRASPGRAQPGRRALSRSPSANSLFILNDLQGLQREPSLENIGVAPVETWSLGIPVETSLSELSSSEEDEDDDDDDEPVAPPPPPPPRARGGRRRASAPRKMAGGRKARVQEEEEEEEEEDSEDGAGATAKPPCRTVRSSGRTRGSASARGRATSTRGRATSTRGRASTARAPVASRIGPTRSAARRAAVQASARPTREELDKFLAESTELFRRAEEEYAALRAEFEAIASADSEDDSDSDTSDTDSIASAVSKVGSIAPAVQLWRPIADDVADFTPSPSRTPPVTTSTPAPAPALSATSELAATPPQKTSESSKGKERVIETRPEVEERANTPASPRRSNLHARVDPAVCVKPLPAPSTGGAPALPNHGLRKEREQQIANAPMTRMAAIQAAHYSPPASAHSPSPAPAQTSPPAPAHQAPSAPCAPPAPAQVQPTAPVPWSVPSAHAHKQFTNTPMDGMSAVPPAPGNRQRPASTHYRAPAPSYHLSSAPVHHQPPSPAHHHQLAAHARSSYGAVPPHATVEALLTGSAMFPAPPPMQSQPLVQAPVVSHGSVRANKRPWSSTQEPWAANYTSAAAPAPAHAQGTMGAYVAGPTHSSTPASSSTSFSSAQAQYSTHTDVNGVARDIARLPRTAAMSSATIRPAYACAYGTPVGVMTYPRVVHADAVPPTLREAAYLLHELMDGRAVLSEQLCEQIVQCHSVLREHLEKAKDLAPKTPAHLLPPTYEGMKLIGEPAEPGKMHWACRWPHQGLPGKICGRAFVIDPDELDDSKNRNALFSQICNHLGHDIHASVDCQWGGGCGRGQVYQNIGGHIGQHHIFEYIRDAKRARLA